MAFHFTIPQASIQDTLRYILNFVNRYSTDPFVLQFAKELDSSGDKEQFIKRLFNYICTNGYYKLDEDGEEEVWTPAKTIRTRNATGKFQYDCKKITILIGSVLKAAGIEPVLKHVYYSDGKGGFKDYTHIYIIVPYPDMDHYLTVDPTNNCQWNTEVDHDKATLYFLNGQKQETAPMNLHVMGNSNHKTESPSLLTMFGESAGFIENDMNAIVHDSKTISGSGNKFSKEGNFYHSAAASILHGANVAIMWGPRAAFLGLLYLGGLLKNTKLKINLPFNLANTWGHTSNAPMKDADGKEFKGDDPRKEANSASNIKKLWWTFGGEADGSALKKAILAGVKGTGITSESMGKISTSSYDRPYIITDINLHGVNGSIGQGPETLAAITAATPIIIALLALIKKTTGGTVPGPDTPSTIPPDGVPPPPPPGPSAGSMLDLSSPVNTIVKSVFLMGISGMVSGPSYYILNIACMAAICFSFIKSIR